jgi:superfamily I DNA and RNA helicase
MVSLLPSIPEYSTDIPAQEAWAILQRALRNDEGTCYYRHPAIRSASGAIPDFTILSRSHQPLIVRVLPWSRESIQRVGEGEWTIDGEAIDPPTLQVEDLVYALKANFDRERSLRKVLSPRPVLAFPLIPADDCPAELREGLSSAIVLWRGGEFDTGQVRLPVALDDDQWHIARAVLQGARPLSSASATVTTKASTLGEAIRVLEKQIAYLDEDQEKVAIPIAPGPQRIRGLAGTGKTVLLAMKAANIHMHYPDKKILFTFNTQSLYNQSQRLITRFYRFLTGIDPDWGMLHVRHAWGGKSRPGVYTDLSGRQGTVPLNLNEARRINSRNPLQACCQSALKNPILPEYSFVLVDEAQDFPKEFFTVLFKLASEPHRIYWAYDELQSLFSLEIPRPEDLFGVRDDGTPNVTLEGEDYPGGIEKDLVLHRSYRCPHQTLMAAHGIGLGIYSKQGCVQMLQDRASWEAIGYIVERGELREGEQVVIYRPPENSPNPITQLYAGPESLISVNLFDNRSEELDWIAGSVTNDIREEGVPPEQIIVISLDALRAREYMTQLQARLFSNHIGSTIPGLIHDSAAFGEEGKVTLTSVNRAKGNEAAVVYILSFESLYDFVAPVEGRNRAFTAISRTKAFVRISGIGKEMTSAKEELEAILASFPRFLFDFPDMEAIRRLDADTAKRRRAFEAAKLSAKELMGLDPEVLAALAKQNPEILQRLARIIEEARREGG